jgi:hypothetical protein
MSTLALVKWADKRFKPMAMLAQVAAVCAYQYQEILERTRTVGSLEIPIPNLDDWLKLYSRPFQLWEVLAHLLEKDSCEGLKETIEQSSSTYFEYKQLAYTLVPHLLSKEVGVWNRKFREWVIDPYYHLQHVPLLERMVRQEDLSPPNVAEWFTRPEPSFLLRVVVPCWLEYGTTPWHLFLQARRNDAPAFEAFDKLLRLDPMVDQEKRLRKTLNRWQQTRPNQFKELQKARGQGRAKHFDLSNVKDRIAGLLIKWSREWEEQLKGGWLFGTLAPQVPKDRQKAFQHAWNQYRERCSRIPIRCRLGPADVKQLFDAAAHDMHALPYDSHFNEAKESWERRIRHKTKLWPSLRETDINRAA